LGSNDLSPDLALGILAPASAVRAVEGHSPNDDAEAKSRRRSRRTERPGDDDQGSSEPAETPLHQLDRLA